MKVWIECCCATASICQATEALLPFAGCTFCKPPVNKLSPEIIHACSTEFFKAFAYSKCTLEVAYRTLIPDKRDGSYLAPDCEYEKADLGGL